MTKISFFSLLISGGRREKEKEKYNTNVSDKNICTMLKRVTSKQIRMQGERKKGWGMDEEGLKC